MRNFKILTIGMALICFIISGCAPMTAANVSSQKTDICKTKYPLVLIHGVGFRDSEILAYWGRIPDELEANGATIYYGQQDGFGSIESNAKMLKDRINEILAETNSGKVNIIAHSKGGLDARYMIANLGMADSVASLTTIGTPHHGVKTMDALQKLSPSIFHTIAFPVNSMFNR